MLHVTIQINERTIEYFGIRRLYPIDRQPTASTLCRYVVTDAEQNELGEVTHRYGNKAASLVRKVLKQFGS